MNGQLKCPNCGGPVRLEPRKEEQACPLCAAVFNVRAVQEMEQTQSAVEPSKVLNWPPEDPPWLPGERQRLAVYACRSCFGEVVADDELGAINCPFCGSLSVMATRFSDSIRPDLVIPFKLDKADVLQIWREHYAGKKLLPRIFRDENRLENITGVYVPLWLFDAEVDARLEYRARKTRRWSDAKYYYTETSVFRVLREGRLGFEWLPVNGSKAINDALLQAIEPFWPADAVDFQTPCLAGFFASKYDRNRKESTQTANSQISQCAAEAFADTAEGYDTVITKKSDVKLRNGVIRSALVPVWLLGTSWKGKKYIFAVNGQTGKFAADLPLDKKACRRWFAAIFGVSALLLLTISALIGLVV